jgi:4'-phosphopantetheinyl transferase
MALSEGDVHIWHLLLDQPAPLVQQFAHLLSTDERAKAGRFHFERDRRRYTVGRGFLRCLLGNYLDVEPQQLQFDYGPHGKPFLAGLSHPDALSFNLSHAHQFALYAVTCDRKIGIDLEYIRQVSEPEQIVERFFTAREIEAFYALEPSQRLDAFFRVWTFKEAYLKATGAGLSKPLNEIEIPVPPLQPVKLSIDGGHAQPHTCWSLQELSVAPGYVAALAVDGDEYHITCWQRPEDVFPTTPVYQSLEIPI